MTWATRFRLEQQFRGSIWIWPLIGGLLGVAGASLSILLDSNVTPPAYWQYSSSTATTVLATIVGAPPPSPASW